MKKRSHILNSVVILSVVGVLVGGYFVVSNLDRLFKSILPGMHASPSKSMKPYTITLRTPDYWGETKERDKVHEWKLVLPRAFVNSEFGDPDDLKKTYIVNLHTVINPNTLEITPATLSKRRQFLDEGIIISLRNRSTRNNKEKCIRGDKYFENYVYKCESHHVKCRIYTKYKGWNIRLQIVKKYFYNANSYCNAVIDFLRNITVNIDNLAD